MSEVTIAQRDLPSNSMKPGDYVIVIANSQHSFAGTIIWHRGDDVMLSDARLLPYWMSYLMLTDVAAVGLDDYRRFKLPRPVKQMMIVGAKAIVECSDKCRDDLTACPPIAFDKAMVQPRRAAIVESDVNPYQDTFGT